MIIQSGQLGIKARIVNVPCPRCGAKVMEIRAACCGERRRGVKAIRRCKKCGYKVRVK